MEDNHHPPTNEQLITNRLLAHDLRNGLSPILMYAEILETSLAKLSLEQEEQTARLITESVKEMNNLIRIRLDSHDSGETKT